MRNIILTPQPFTPTGGTPTIDSYSTSLGPVYPVENALSFDFPSRPWKTTVQTAEYLIYDMTAVTPSLAGAYLYGTNYRTIRLWNVAGLTTTLIGPNLLKHSHRVGSWANTNNVASRTDDYATGPDPFGPLASRVVLNTAGSVGSDLYTTYGPNLSIASKPFTASVWAKLNPAGSTSSASIQLSFLVNNTTQVAPVSQSVNNRSWTQVRVSGTVLSGMTGDTGTALYVIGSNLDLLLWGAQLTVGSSQYPFTTYETNSSGLKINKNPATLTTQQFYDLGAIAVRKLKLEIPSGTTVDDGDASSYSTGCFFPVESATSVFGGHGYPVDQGLIPAFLQSEFEDKSLEYLKLGDHRMYFTIPMSWIMSQNRARFWSLLRNDPGRSMLYIENILTPGGNENLPDPTQAYIVKATNIDQLANFPIPEYAERSIDLVQVI